MYQWDLFISHLHVTMEEVNISTHAHKINCRMKCKKNRSNVEIILQN